MSQVECRFTVSVSPEEILLNENLVAFVFDLGAKPENG